MKMLMVVFRHSLDQHIRQLLQELDVKAFTEAPKVFGMGEAGQAYDSFDWPGFNALILAAMEDDQAAQVIGKLKAFRDGMSQKQQGGKIPMRVFTLPCERII
jgi:hypothetical protein